MNNSLSRQLLSSFGISLVIVGASTLVINYSLLQNNLEKQVQKRAQSIARSLEFATEGLIEYSDTSILQRMVQNYATLPTVVHCAVVSPDGLAIGHSDQNINISFSSLHPEMTAYVEKAATTGLELTVESKINNRSVIIYFLPFSSSLFRYSQQNSSRRGLVIVTIDLQQVKQEASEIFLTSTLTMIMGTLVILGFMVFIIQVHALYPLKQLNQAIALSKDTGVVNLPASLPANEIGYLANTLVVSIAQLQEFERSKNEELSKMNTELEALSQTLELKVLERTNALTMANIQLKQAKEGIDQALIKEKQLNQLRSSFIATASHEFRTPLTVIGSSAAILETYSDRLSADRKKDHLDRIQSSVKHMVSLIDDVLTMNRAEANKLEFMPELVDLVPFCQELTEELQLSTKKHQIIFNAWQNDLTKQTLTTLKGQYDPKLLRQILNNLLSNAIKYSPQGGLIHFNLFTEENNLVLQVQDQGIGIPLDAQTQLFDPFYRAENVGTIAGTGLGLAIVKKCVDAHKGIISVDTRECAGTTWTVTIFMAG